MAEKTLNTRIQLKYDLYDNWKTHNPQLKKGELAIVEVPVDAKKDDNGNVVPQQPAILFKIGDGTKTFNQLDWASAKAADVHDWAKASTRPTYAAADITGIDTYIANYVNDQMGISVDTDTQYTIVPVEGDAYKYKLMSKSKLDSSFATEVAEINIPKYDDTALAGEVTALKGLVGDKAVATQISDALTKLENDGVYFKRQDGEELNRRVTTLEGDSSVEGSVKQQISAAIRAEEFRVDDILQGQDKDIEDHEERIAAIEDEILPGLNTRVENLEDAVGTLEDLETTNKSDLVVAINEVRNAVSAGGTAAAITIDTSATTEGALKSYTIKQGENTVGTIDIPKDMVVESGEVVTNPAGQDEGTYIKLVLANVAEPLYINVGHLVDIYKAKANATQVQIAIDSATREISATIVAGSVGTTELADNAVVTAKIANGNVTKEKLSTTVQGSLDKADSAVQSVVEGTANGTIKVDGTDVNVHGLGTAAYKAEGDFAPAGEFSTVKDKVGTLEDKAHTHSFADEEALSKITQAKVNAWDAAEQNAKDHATQLVEGLDSSVAATAADGNQVSVLTGVTEVDGKLTDKTEVKLAAIAKTGNVNDLIQTEGDVIVFNCGTASTVL